MSARAALPMYDWPELRDRVDAFYANLRGLVPDLPETLTRVETEEQMHALWRAPDMVLAQSCWGPMQSGLGAYVDVLAQPRYDDVPGGRGSHYRSALVMRAGKSCAAPLSDGACLPQVLAQSCWGPMQSGLDAHVHVLAQPRYDDVPGGRGSHYRSALVMRAGQSCAAPLSDGACLPQGLAHLRPAINAPDSMSGCLALMQDMHAPDLTQRALVTGSHRASIRAVAEGRADFAAIDCRSWAYALSHEPAARMLTVTGWTALRPGLPFITSRHTPVALRARLEQALVQLGAAPA